jgi:hypothetical protein
MTVLLNAPWTIRTAKTVKEAQHEPRTYWDAHKTQNQMIRGMLPVNFSTDSREYHQNKINEALQEMRVRDAWRVRNLSGLTNPFTHKPLA